MTHAELDDRLGELLLAYNVIPAGHLERARKYQATKGSTLPGALCDLHVVPQDTLRSLLEELTGVRAVDPSLMTVYPDFVEKINLLIPPEVIHALLVFPVQMEINRLHVCMLNPTDGWTMRVLEALSGCRVMPMVTHEAAVVEALEEHYGKHLPGAPKFGSVDGKAVVDATYRRLLDAPFANYVQPAISLINRNRDAIARDRDGKAIENLVRDPAIIRLVQQVLCRAIETGASDIHIEPTGDQLRIRTRVDGSMRVIDTLPAAAGVPILARLKAMAELPIGPAAMPLDARIGYDLVLGRGVDLRFSLVPAITGEKVVLRVLDRSRERRQLSDLGVDAHTLGLIEQAADLPNGLLLVTGPTGSGKSSTLYALLDRLNSEDTCLLTAEDPVESRIAGVTQVQCDEDKGLTYAAVLRSFLRQDPDVMMVGEIRDLETADIALKAALTGHLVLSTLHTNDSPGAVLRLVNMNLEPFIIASSLRLIVAQRLIRRLCSSCKKPMASLDEVSPGIKQMIATSDVLQRSGDARFYEPAGCPSCGGSGYRGRTGIFEVLRVTPAIEELILARASASEVRTRARAEGMRTLRDAGLAKALAGETSLAEVLEHTIGDEGNSDRGSGAATGPDGTAGASGQAGGATLTTTAGRS
jgi:type IV pilus assembly protein PilB